MEYKLNPVLQEDLRSVVTGLPSLAKLSGRNVMVTGGTGLVGSLLVKTLLLCNALESTDIQVYTMIRNPEKAKKLYGDMLDDTCLHLIVGDITDPAAFDACPDMDYILHTASITASKIMVSQPVETIRTSLRGTENLLELARRSGSLGFVYVSSMEMYGNMGDITGKTDESMLGYIDPLKVRSNYPESKRMCENMCIAYLSEYHVPVRIARLAQTFGAGILPGENRVFAQFARSAVRGEDIVLHTRGLSEGNYCYTRDAVRGLLLLLTEGQDGEAYNVCNESTHTTIAAMAEMVCREISGGKSHVVFDIPESNVFGYAADAKLQLDSTKLQSLGWKPEVDLPAMYRRMIAYMELENEV